MKYITDIHSYRSLKSTAVTLGKFDGMHRGHQKLISRIQKHEAKDCEGIVFVFDMHKDSLMTDQERIEMLAGRVDCLISCPFTEEIRRMDAEAFIRDVLYRKLRVCYIAVGEDYRFGYGKKGDVQMLASCAEKYGYRLEVIEKERYQGRIISSTYIKEELARGAIETANHLLGYRYTISGFVEYGRQLGRTLGFPTVNVAPAQGKITPRFGVYACRVNIEGIWYEGIGNVGVKPTVSEGKRVLVEVHAFGYNADAYGKFVKIEFCGFRRPETSFSSVDELKRQVDEDILYGKDFFASGKL